LTRAGELPPYDHWLPPVRAADGRYVIYLRKAIPDHGVPAAAAMGEILDDLAGALQVGHRVYVHCRAGIGRTNTVIGCWLRRGGLEGREAILRLNELWLANPRARFWPHVPETEEQERFVLDWSDAAEGARRGEVIDLPLDLGAARQLRARYQGSLLGLACGDALGATLQFRKPGGFPPLADLVGGGHWQLPAGAWTDDTAMSLCVAESLLTLEAFDAADLLRRYRRWQQEGTPSSTGQCVGITLQVAAALQDGTHRGAKPKAAARRAPPTSAQAVTRAGVVALFAASNPARAFAWSAAAAALTDRSAAVGAAAMVYAALMLAALRGAPREALLAEARALWRAHAGAPANAFDKVLKAATAARTAGAPRTAGAHRKAGARPKAGALRRAGAHPKAGGADAEAPAALRRVVSALLAAGGFREGVLAIVNQGGDTDVHGALYGQLAGALYGVHGIPAAWHGALLGRPLLEEIADRLLAAALAPRD